MKKILLIILIVIIIAIVLAGAVYFLKPTALEKSGSGTSSGQGTVAGEGSIISIKDLKFNPATVNIKVGEKVTWKNEDSVLHDVTLDNGAFDIDIEPGTSFTYLFEETGIYEYHCDIHPSMIGTVKLK